MLVALSTTSSYDSASRLTVVDHISNEMNMHMTCHAGNKYVV